MLARVLTRITSCLVAAGLLSIAAIASRAHAEAEAPFGRGINITRLFDTPKLQPGPARAYATPPFGPWRAQVTEAELVRLREAGFDFIRLPIDPGPLLALPEEVRSAAIDQVFDFVAAARAFDFGVVLDLHNRPDNREWNAAAILQSLEGDKFARLQRLVRDLAGRLAARNDPRLALELFNEPQRECVRRQGPDWTAFQPRLVAAARQAGPNVNLVITGGCWSSVDGLASLDVKPLGPTRHLFLMIHFYEPHAFTHQGASWSAPVRDLAGLDFPIRPAGREAARAATERAVAARKSLSDEAREKIRRSAEGSVENYHKRPVTPARIAERLKIAADWADRSGLSRRQVIVGEFGVLRTGGIRAVADPDRARSAWLRAVVEASESLGFAWAVWGYDGAFGIVESTRNRKLEPFILEALFGSRSAR
ncbi:glycoside hydrolase family 5 protein [Desertibaculum subflavum]|uniref:glycoside hydrolase family 5 protein n=1 Tax=Desertibaculum subflavum TaxID=2268458 RepID=UPI0013C4C943